MGDLPRSRMRGSVDLASTLSTAPTDGSKKTPLEYVFSSAAAVRSSKLAATLSQGHLLGRRCVQRELGSDESDARDELSQRGTDW